MAAESAGRFAKTTSAMPSDSYKQCPAHVDLDEGRFCDDLHAPFGCHHITDAPGTSLSQDIRGHHSSHGMVSLMVTSHVER